MAGIAASAFKLAGGLTEATGYEQAAEAARVAGRRKNVAAQFEAEQLEQNAGQVVAASQRDAMEERRKADLMASRALALAGASGGGASDTTVVNIIAKLKGEGSYRSAVALYRGEDKARRLRMGAAARRYEGAVAEEGGIFEGAAYDTQAKAARFQAIATAASDAPTLLMKYGGGAPTSGGYR
jgi:hypothetical protein